MIVCARYAGVEITEEHRSFFTASVLFVSCSRRSACIYIYIYIYIYYSYVLKTLASLLEHVWGICKKGHIYLNNNII
jgi:hypothetical protein